MSSRPKRQSRPEIIPRWRLKEGDWRCGNCSNECFGMTTSGLTREEVFVCQVCGDNKENASAVYRFQDWYFCEYIHNPRGPGGYLRARVERAPWLETRW